MSSETDAPTPAADHVARAAPDAIAQIRILAGVPGYPGMRLPSGRYAYPDTTEAFAAQLRAAGFSVTVQHPEDERERVLPKGPEVWIPLIQVGRDLLIATAGGLLTEIILHISRDAHPDADASPPDTATDKRQAIDPPHQAAIDATPQSDALLRIEWQIKDAEGTERTFRAAGPPEAVVRGIEEFVRDSTPLANNALPVMPMRQSSKTDPREAPEGQST